jgi:hypothetical protein
MTRRAALAVAAVLAVGGPVAASAASTPAVPIPSDPRDPAVQSFTGTPATAQPYAAQSIPRNPYMAPNEHSNIHNDAYQTDTYNVAGPLGRDPQVTSTLFAAECASVTFDRAGRLVTVCVSPTGATLRLIDPTRWRRWRRTSSRCARPGRSRSTTSPAAATSTSTTRTARSSRRSPVTC